MPSVENRTFEEIAIGDAASTQRTLQTGDLRAWAAAFGEGDQLADPGASQAAAGIVTAMLTALVGSALPGPGSSIRVASVQIKGALPIAIAMTARLVVREKRRDQGIVVLDGQCADPAGQVVATAILEVLAPTARQQRQVAEHRLEGFTAVINPPQATILAVGAGEERPVVRSGKIEIATIMTVTLTCDHRVVDGALGAELLSAFKALIEHPAMMAA